MKKIMNRMHFMQKASASLSDMIDMLEDLADYDCSQQKPEEICVFSIDMNKGFTRKGALASRRVAEIIEHTADFLEVALNKGIKVTAFSDRHTKGSAEMEAYPEHCTEPEEYELVEELQDLELQPVWKNSTNAFMTGMGNLLAGSYKTYVVTGCCTDICIYQFAVSLKAFLNQNDVKADVVVPLSLVETYDSQWHNGDLMNVVFLNSMASNGVLLCENILL